MCTDMKPCEWNNASAKPKNKIKQNHDEFGCRTFIFWFLKTQQVDGWCSNQPINYMGAPTIYTCHTTYTFCEVSSPDFWVHNSPFGL
jgi:hypothetical protein